MEKTSKYINFLTILVGLAVAVLAYLLISAVDQLRQDTSAKQTELDAALATLTKTEEKSAGDKAALMATKAGLTDDLEDHRGQTARLNLELPENEAKLESLKKQQEEARAEATKKEGEVAGLEAEIAQVEETAGGLLDRGSEERPRPDEGRDDRQHGADEDDDLPGEVTPARGGIGSSRRRRGHGLPPRLRRMRSSVSSDDGCPPDARSSEPLPELVRRDAVVGDPVDVANGLQLEIIGRVPCEDRRVVRMLGDLHLEPVRVDQTENHLVAPAGEERHLLLLSGGKRQTLEVTHGMTLRAGDDNTPVPLS